MTHQEEGPEFYCGVCQEGFDDPQIHPELCLACYFRLLNKDPR